MIFPGEQPPRPLNEEMSKEKDTRLEYTIAEQRRDVKAAGIRSETFDPFKIKKENNNEGGNNGVLQIDENGYCSIDNPQELSAYDLMHVVWQVDSVVNNNYREMNDYVLSLNKNEAGYTDDGLYTVKLKIAHNQNLLKELRTILKEKQRVVIIPDRGVGFRRDPNNFLLRDRKHDMVYFEEPNPGDVDYYDLHKIFNSIKELEEQIEMEKVNLKIDTEEGTPEEALKQEKRIAEIQYELNYSKFFSRKIALEIAKQHLENILATQEPDLSKLTLKQKILVTEIKIRAANWEVVKANDDILKRGLKEAKQKVSKLNAELVELYKKVLPNIPEATER